MILDNLDVAIVIFSNVQRWAPEIGADSPLYLIRSDKIRNAGTRRIQRIFPQITIFIHRCFNHHSTPSIDMVINTSFFKKHRFSIRTMHAIVLHVARLLIRSRKFKSRLPALFSLHAKEHTLLSEKL